MTLKVIKETAEGFKGDNMEWAVEERVNHIFSISDPTVKWAIYYDRDNNNVVYTKESLSRYNKKYMMIYILWYKMRRSSIALSLDHDEIMFSDMLDEADIFAYYIDKECLPKRILKLIEGGVS